MTHLKEYLREALTSLLTSNSNESLGIVKETIISLIVIIISTIILLFLLIIIVKIILYINHRITRKYLSKVSIQRSITIMSLIDNLIKYLFGIIGIFALVINLGVDPAVVLTSAGVGAVILGIAAQELIKDFINGIFTVIEGYYDIGDYIEVNGYEGEVLDLGIKTTTLKTNEGAVITIPNSLIAEIKNYTKINLTIFYEIHTPYEIDVKNIENYIKSELVEKFIDDNLVLNATYSGVQTLDASAVSHMVAIECKPENRYQVKRNLNLIVKNEFEKANIEIPYQKITIYNGNDE